MNACNFAKIAFHDEYVPGTLMIITYICCVACKMPGDAFSRYWHKEELMRK